MLGKPIYSWTLLQLFCKEFNEQALKEFCHVVRSIEKVP